MNYSEYQTRKERGQAEVIIVDGVKVIQYEGYDQDTGAKIVLESSSIGDPTRQIIQDQINSAPQQIVNIQAEADSLTLLLTDWDNLQS